jgi:hypothetical protein
MPDPKLLKVGDKIKYLSVPSEWGNPDLKVYPESREFMDDLINQGSIVVINRIDEYSNAWFDVVIFNGKSQGENTWAVFEMSGWIFVP